MAPRPLDAPIKNAKSSGIARIAVLLAILLFCSSEKSAALDPHILISQYGHTAWRIEDGAFSSQPAGITQTTDGYIWIATLSGLVRFDGVRFVTWTPIRGEHLPNSKITNALGARDGSLWIGTQNGLARLKNGHVTNYPDANGSINGILEDDTGTIWVARSRSTGPLCKVADSETRCYGQADGFPYRYSNAIVEGALGDLWIALDVSLARWKQGSVSIRALPALKGSEGTHGINSLAAGEDGTLWVGTARPGPGRGLQRIVENKWKPLITHELDSSTLAVNALFLDRENMLWVGTNQGIYRIRDNAVDRFSRAEGLSSNFVNGFFQDREGDLWISTAKGIDRFRDVRVVNFSEREGLSADAVDSVLAAHDGTIWVGNLGALDSLRQGKVTSIVTNRGLPGDQVTSLFEDRAGQIWVGVDNSLFVYKEGRFTRINKPDGSPFGVVVAMTEDTDDNVWAETVVPDELVRIRDGKVREEVLRSQMRDTVTLAADPRKGVWFGILKGGFGRYQNGHLDIFPFQTNRMRVSDIIANSDGSLLGATSLGLLGWRSGTFQILDVENGLPCNNVYTLIRDNHGSLWLPSQCGLMVLTSEELQQWWQNSKAVVKVELFDIYDGAQPSSPPFRPIAARSPDGRLWFANESVLQMIDPAHPPRNAIPPPVHIEELIADQRSYSPQTGLRIPPLSRNLEIDYTALSFVIPQKVRFRYKLEGKDQYWQEPGTRRQAFYNDLRPGRYRFLVIACNNSGVWNEAGASLDFSILPAYYQTSWFRMGCVVALLALLWAAYRLRVQQLQRRFAIGLEARVNERTRIARDLHDTLLQSFQGMMLRLQLVEDLLPEGKAKDQLEQTLQRGDQAIAEGRRAVYDLRSSTAAPTDLAQAFKALGDEFATENSAAFRLVVEGEARDLNSIIRDELYFIAREALRNAFSHARAHHIEAEITYGERSFRLRIRDDGEGIPTQVLEEGRPGHYGLSGMRERAKQVGGKVDFWSRAGAGTEIDLSIPGSIAYRTSVRRSLFSLVRKNAG